MISFKPIVFHQVKPKGGAYNVKIRVTYKGVSRYLPTTLFCSASELTRQGKIKPGNTLTKGNILCDEMRKTLEDISPFTLEAKDVDWVVKHIKSQMRYEHFTLDFFEWADEAMQTKNGRTRRIYEMAVKSFRRYAGDTLDINDITTTLVKGFIGWVNTTPVYRSAGRGKTEPILTDRLHNPGAGERKTKYLSVLYKMAQDKYNDEDSGKILIPKHPFNRVVHTLPPTYMSQKSIGIEGIQMLIDYKPTSSREVVARDCFLISFLLMGANIADIYEALPPINGRWEYNRAKTRDRRADKAKMIVYVPEEVKPYIDRHLDQSGKYWLDLWMYYSSPTSITNTINAGLNTICENCGCKHFTMYAARKSWATIARQLGIEKATIDECLAHIGDYRIADIYIERNWDLINAANRKVLSQFRW